MPLKTAPCPKCGHLLVYGQRQCLRCGERFDYGANPPPEPTPEQVREALVAAGALAPPVLQAPAPQVPYPQAAPPTSPGAPSAPASEADIIDRGRFDDALAAPVQPEAVPGLIDSRLFGAFTPKEVQAERLEGLETTAIADPRAPPPPPDPMNAQLIEHTAFPDVGAVPTEAVPGLIDSTLLKAFTPENVETQPVEGLETSHRAARPTPAKKRSSEDAQEGMQPCSECGTPHDRSQCPECGALRKDEFF